MQSSHWNAVTDGYDSYWTDASDREAEYPDPQRQTLPRHLMSDTAISTREEDDTYRAREKPPPLPHLPPVGELETEMPTPTIKPKRKFIPDSLKDFLRGRRGRAKQISNFNLGWGEECSPPVSPLLSRRRATSTDGEASELDSQQAAKWKDSSMFSDGTRTKHEMEADTFPSDFAEKQPETAQSYMERIHVYKLKHAYMKSWPGLLRVLGVMELLFGAVVVACICAYVQKDSQWYNIIGGSLPAYGFGDNYYYTGPKTPFVLVMVSLAWIVTLGVLILGLTLYYRTILLDSNWWPLTEFTMNTCLFFLYMAAGIVYVNSFSHGGLCYSMMVTSPLYYQLCRVDSGQIAAAAFLFVNMVLYLVSAGVCLKVWRHEQIRRAKEAFRNKHQMAAAIGQKQSFSFRRLSFRRNAPKSLEEGVSKDVQLYSKDPSTLNKSIPAGYIPKPLIIPDYITKYPKIECAEERERYKGVFNDQYAEYKQLHSEIHAANKKFKELKVLIEKLPRYTENSEEHKRIMKILEDYKEKINDPTFMEKKERCTYLKNKLSYIKQRIQEYDLERNSVDSY